MPVQYQQLQPISMVMYFMYNVTQFEGLMLIVPVHSYGHVGMVSSPNHTFFPGQT